MFAVIGAIGLIWQELEMIQGSTVISIFKTSE
jgi:hypothetical protein